MKKSKNEYNVSNERLKIKYFEFLKQARGLVEKTINVKEKSIKYYDDFSGCEDYKKLSIKRIIDFKDYIKTSELKISSINNILKNLQDFFTWLASQNGYKNKIKFELIEYFNLPRGEKRIAQSKSDIKYPSLDEIKTVINSIKPDSEMNRRNRALLSFAILSGMRVSAIISLPLKAFNPETLEVFQDPRLGVNTKFSKTINSLLMPFELDLLQEVLDWVNFLKQEKNFKGNDPIFPAMKLGHQGNVKTFKAVEVKPEFLRSASHIYKIFEESFINANLEPYSPHKFRHTAIDLALEKCQNGKQLKAISQIFGHENIQTTISVYAQLPEKEVKSIIHEMFNKSAEEEQNKFMEELCKFYKYYSKNKFLKI